MCDYQVLNYCIFSLFLLFFYYTLYKMLGCFNPTLGQIWTNPNIGLKMSLKNVTQWLGLSIFDPKLG